MSNTAAETETFQELVTFFLDNEEFGVDVGQVVEVNRDLLWTPIPGGPAYVRGAANLRGHIVTVLDMRRIMGYGERPENLANTVIIAYMRDELVGMLVDRIADVIQAPRQNLEPPPFNLPAEKRRCIVSVLKSDTGLIGILDLDVALE